MADFDKAMAYLSALEGGYVNDPDDRGGATKFGVSLNFYKHNIDKYADEQDIRALTREDAENIYREWFWYPSGVEALDSKDLASRVFALVVHAGIKPAIRVLQKAVNQSGYSLAVDGVLGPKTANAANSVDARQLLPDFRHETLKFYQEILSHRTQMQKYSLGWTRRALA